MKPYFTIILFLCSYIFLGQDRPIGEIPFTINENGLIVITLQINDELIPNFVLDTGASVTVLDEQIATRLKLELRKEIYQSTGANRVVEKGRKIQKQRLSLHKNIVLKSLELSINDLASLGKINGIIGFDLFREYVTETNFDTQLIRFYKRKGKPDTTGYRAIDFVESFCTPEIDISVSLTNNQSFSGKVLFDTGNVAYPLTFNTPFVKKHQLPSKFERLITTESRGIHTTSKNLAGVAKAIKIDDYELAEIPVSLSNTKQGMSSKESYMGNLGLDYISKFNFILDYHRKKIYLKPNSLHENPFGFPLSGIRLEQKENGIFIKSISKPSMAEEKGLKAGQQLISIDGIKEKDIRFYYNVLKDEGKDVSIVVRQEDGTFKTVKILLKRLI